MEDSTPGHQFTHFEAGTCMRVGSLGLLKIYRHRPIATQIHFSCQQEQNDKFVGKVTLKTERHHTQNWLQTPSFLHVTFLHLFTPYWLCSNIKASYQKALLFPRPLFSSTDPREKSSNHAQPQTVYLRSHPPAPLHPLPHRLTLSPRPNVLQKFRSFHRATSSSTGSRQHKKEHHENSYYASQEKARIRQ